MLRSRKQKTSSTSSNNEESSDRMKAPYGSSDMRSSVINNISGSQHQPLIPIPILIAIVLLFLFLGVATEHFKRTRGVDPITGRKVDPSATVSYAKVNPLSGKSMLSSEEDKMLEYSDNQRYHVIFSTDCSPYQHWQSYLVYYTAMKVRQPGHVIRIASGCEKDEAKAMQQWFDENIRYMSTRFHLMLTPHFSEVRNEKGEVVGDYKFFNKPFGLKYWLETFHELGFQDGKFGHEDDIVILIDPDMAILRPITSDFSSERDTVIAKRRQGENMLGTKVEHGRPFAQTYGLGTQWQKFDLEKIAGEDSPAKKVDQNNGALYYPVGPPYLGTVRDMYQISLKWTEFVPRVHAQYPYLLAEMYAFCIAAAHLELPHQIIDSLMVSNPGVGGEGWPLVDRIPPQEMCEFAAKPDHGKHALPSVLHLCQRYSVGDDWFFGKRKIPHDIYECETPLFIEPPKDLATLYTYKKPPNAKERTDLTPKVINQETFMLCHLTALINEASSYYKANACPGGTANLKKSRKVADLFKTN